MERVSNFLYYYILVILFGFCMYYLHSRSLFILLLIFLVFPLISFVITKLAVRKLELKAVPKNLWTDKNTETEVEFIFKNHTCIPFLSLSADFYIENRFYKNNSVNTVHLSIPAFGEYRFKVPVTPVYNGGVNVNIKNAHVRDMLNIFDIKTKASAGCCFYTIPAVTDEGFIFAPGELYSEESLISVKNANGTQPDGIRDYMAGDKLRNIHWKLSTKYRELLVKEYSDNNEESAILLAELYLPAIDAIIDRLYSIGTSLIESGYTYTLGFASAGSEQLTKLFITDKNTLRDSLEKLYLSYPSQSNNASLFALRREYAGDGIIYIHGDNDKAVTDIL